MPTPAVIKPEISTMIIIFKSGKDVIILYVEKAPTAINPPVPRETCPQYPVKIFKPIAAILTEIESVLESSSEVLAPKKSKKKLFIIVGLILALGGCGFGFYLTMGSVESHDEESHSSDVHSSDSTHNENLHQPVKTIEEIDDEIEQAEKDSVAEDIIDAAEAIQFIR